MIASSSTKPTARFDPRGASACLSAKPDAFLDVLVASRAWLLSHARGHLRNIEWAKDAVSETMLAAMERRPDFDDASRVQAWLQGILRHKVVDQVRRHLDGRLVLEGIDDNSGPLARAEASSASDPAGCAIRAEFTSALAIELELLPETHARAVVLCDGWGKSTGEVCEELGVTPGNLSVILHRARGRLRTALSPHHG